MRRKKNETFRAVLVWKPQRNTPRGRPKKIWIFAVDEDLETLGVDDCKEVVQDKNR